MSKGINNRKIVWNYLRINEKHARKHKSSKSLKSWIWKNNHFKNSLNEIKSNLIDLSKNNKWLLYTVILVFFVILLFSFFNIPSTNDENNLNQDEVVQYDSWTNSILTWKDVLNLFWEWMNWTKSKIEIENEKNENLTWNINDNNEYVENPDNNNEKTQEDQNNETTNNREVLEEPLVSFDNTEEYNIEEGDITIIKTWKMLEFNFFNNTWNNAVNLINSGKYSHVMNWSYFKVIWWNISHSWLLNVWGTIQVPIEYSDRNLTHIVTYNKKNGKITINKNDEYEEDKNQNIIQFQAWPLVLENNIVQERYIYKSSIWAKKYTRTLLWVDSDWVKYLIVARKPVSLIDLWFFLRKNELFKWKSINLINLDWWSSTSFASNNSNDLNFNENKNLPNRIWVKK